VSTPEPSRCAYETSPDLLLASGWGPGTYSVIGQGAVASSTAAPRGSAAPVRGREPRPPAIGRVTTTACSSTHRRPEPSPSRDVWPSSRHSFAGSMARHGGGAEPGGEWGVGRLRAHNAHRLAVASWAHRAAVDRSCGCKDRIGRCARSFAPLARSIAGIDERLALRRCASGPARGGGAAPHRARAKRT